MLAIGYIHDFVFSVSVKSLSSTDKRVDLDISFTALRRVRRSIRGHRHHHYNRNKTAQHTPMLR